MGNVRMRAEQINYGASNVKVALDDLDPKDLIALSARMDTIEAWKATVKAEEKTGASVEYTNALALDAVSLSAEIEPIQDLHGYDKPWAGGVNVQLVDFSTYASLSNNISFDYIDGNVTLTSTGTTSDYPSVVFNILNLKGKTLYFSDTFTSSDEGLGHIQIIYNVNGQQTYLEVGKSPDPQTGYTIPNDVTSADLKFYLRNGTSVASGKWVKYSKIMCAASANPTYSPYANICPISGRTSVTITDYDSESNTATVTVQLGQTVYGGTLNVTTGVLTVTHANIASYNGETIGEPWISSLDEYTQGGTPTTGAQVVYTLATPTTIQLTPEQLTMLKGYNRLSSDGGGDITVKAYTGAPWGGDEA